MAARAAILLSLAAGVLAQGSAVSLASSTAAASASASATDGSTSTNSTGASNGTLVAYAEVTGSGIDMLVEFIYVPGQGVQVQGKVSGLPVNQTLEAAGNATLFPYHIRERAH